MDTIKILGEFLYDQKTAVGVTCFSIFGQILFIKLMRIRKEKQEVGKRPLRLIVISGCDSGLGLSMAYWAGTLGYKVLAGCYNPNSEGADYLRKEFSQDVVRVAKLDVTDDESIDAFRMECEQFLDTIGVETKLWAVVPNAGVMVCGEWFWQTQDQRQRQMKVNFWGTVNLVSAFQPLIFQNQSRLIVITSDCSEHSLPSLAGYDASKAAQQAWARSLRLEVGKYGVSVVCYQPGSFPNDSRIFANAANDYKEMECGMKESDKEFYGEYFRDYKKIKSEFSSKQYKIEPLKDNAQRKCFTHLLEGDIRHISVYRYRPFFQVAIQFIDSYFPHRLSDPFLRFLMDGRARKWEPPKGFLRNLRK